MKTKLSAVLLALALFAPALRADLAPDSVSGLTATALVTSGTGFFASSGGYRLAMGATTLAQTPITPNIFAQNFTYTYQKTSPNSAKINFTDTATNATATETLTFETSASATFVITSSVGAQSGKLVLEYGAPVKLINISTLGRVDSTNILTAGFVIAGGVKTVLIRAMGPSLTQLGVGGAHPNPKLTLINAAGLTVATNDDWGNGTGATLSAAASAAGAFAFASPTSKDAAVLVSLTPGNYTAQVSSSDGPGGVDRGASGAVIVEVYEMPPGT